MPFLKNHWPNDQRVTPARRVRYGLSVLSESQVLDIRISIDHLSCAMIVVTVCLSPTKSQVLIGEVMSLRFVKLYQRFVLFHFVCGISYCC